MRASTCLIASGSKILENMGSVGGEPSGLGHQTSEPFEKTPGIMSRSFCVTIPVERRASVAAFLDLVVARANMGFG